MMTNKTKPGQTDGRGSDKSHIFRKYASKHFTNHAWRPERNSDKCVNVIALDYKILNHERASQTKHFTKTVLY